MKFLPTHRRFGSKAGKKLLQSAPDTPDVLDQPVAEGALEESPLLKTVGWVSAGVGAIALGVIVGREIRQRYKFNRKTPYDLYAHSGDLHDLSFDFGLGI